MSPAEETLVVRIASSHRARWLGRLSDTFLVAAIACLLAAVLRLLVAVLPMALVAVALMLTGCPRPEAPPKPGDDPGPADSGGSETATAET